ncbi:DNA integrity scanning protein DisA [Novipirellula galeiformis]|uniref:DNA integrity scanning protein DisA n=1 Tax=Novipirellula galeiformis TaxID=2528004 RepID=A0A5C6C8F5_9BACT|nr:DNA integrity scanning protein DisA [Novipirellula galeiformis]
MENRVEFQELIDALHIVELSGTTRQGVLQELFDAVNWERECVSPSEVVKAMEGCEATTPGIPDTGLTLHHAKIDWPGHFRLVLGRSRCGESQVREGDSPHLVGLLVVGRESLSRHLDLLGSVAELFGHAEFRGALSTASDPRELKQLFIDRVLQPPRGDASIAEIPQQSLAIANHAVGLATSLSAQAILVVLDPGQAVPWSPLNSWAGRLLIVTATKCEGFVPGRADIHLLDVMHTSLSRMDRAKLGLLLAAANGLVDEQRDVVCVTGSQAQALDSITVTRPAPHFRAVFPRPLQANGTTVRPEVILRVLSLAIEIASEGRESRQIGTMFVIGDTRQVARQSRQLVLNPFHGFARNLRNVLEPGLTETVKEFALLDGAFIIDADGSIRSAGSYLIPQSIAQGLASGLGARHQAAASITRATRATAVTVSQSTGTVTLFQQGGMVLTLERAALTRW